VPEQQENLKFSRELTSAPLQVIKTSLDYTSCMCQVMDLK